MASAAVPLAASSGSAASVATAGLTALHASTNDVVVNYDLLQEEPLGTVWIAAHFELFEQRQILSSIRWRLKSAVLSMASGANAVESCDTRSIV
ncbi:hypothetical protein ZEAMMB73_Zm00001d037940 [Zea mays]|uniref:Uncharacterized protein n=1 Tax=Zea mays TaxID=4577 RepID=A0A1D6M203_MAIZE|nr:hypothetical protein ZEAMMB73_Zm00001d037940 [Zea mays]